MEVPTFISPDLGTSVWQQTEDIDQITPFLDQWWDKQGTKKAGIPAGMLQEDSPLDRGAPKGMIFHASRCGSSAVVNYFQAYEEVVVLPEAQPLGLVSMTGNPAMNNGWSGKRKSLLRGLVATYTHALAESQHLVLKLASWNILGMSIFAEVFPQTPILTVIRQPSEILVSLVRQPSGIASLRHQPAFAKAIFPFDAESCQTDEEFLARTLTSFYDAIWEFHQQHPDTLQVLDYKDLNAERLNRVADHFGLEEGNRAAIESLKYDAKATQQKPRIYEEDSAAKQKLAKGRLAELAESLCQSSYERLLSLAMD
ncbi:MAG: hypothetical protein AAFQ98_25865 [Bacteroidota bacterium]